jgi:hypothetical protein
VYNETKLLDKIRPLNERKVTKTRNPSRKRAPQFASRRKVGCCEQQINNNAHPIYLARDEVAETPGKEEGKAPKRYLPGKGAASSSPRGTKVFMYSPDFFLQKCVLGLWRRSCCCAVLVVRLPAVLLSRQFQSPQLFESRRQYLVSF